MPSVVLVVVIKPKAKQTFSSEPPVTFLGSLTMYDVGI